MTAGAPSVAKPKSLHCPNCGGSVERRGFGHTLTIACPSCAAVLDATSPLLDILQRAEIAQTRQPIIPLGSRGTMSGGEWEVIGFQVRALYVDGDRYEWEEYLLFNPYRGFRYLTQYNGHWNFVTTLEVIPAGGGLAVTIGGHSYKHFSHCQAITEYVVGEFPWQVRFGDKVEASDYVAPPYILSSESTPEETTWSQGVYTEPAEVWRAFGLQGSPPRPHGVYLNQPSPAGKGLGMWSVAVMLLALVFVSMMYFAFFSKREQVLDLSRSFSAREGTGEPSFVTPVFELRGRQTTLEVSTRTNLANNWAFFNYALINDDTGQAFDFGREVSYYSGTDSDGAWTEGSSGDTMLVPSVPPGRYYLRVEPDADPTAPPMQFQITLRHDVPVFGWFFIAGALILIPPVISTIRRLNFERLRWAESDYAPTASSGDDSDSGDDDE